MSRLTSARRVWKLPSSRSSSRSWWSSSPGQRVCWSVWWEKHGRLSYNHWLTDRLSYCLSSSRLVWNEGPAWVSWRRFTSYLKGFLGALRLVGSPWKWNLCGVVITCRVIKFSRGSLTAPLEGTRRVGWESKHLRESTACPCFNTRYSCDQLSEVWWTFSSRRLSMTVSLTKWDRGEPSRLL